MVLVLVSSSLLAEVVEFKDGGTHYVDSTVTGYVLVDYQTPDMHTTVNLIDGGSINWFECYGAGKIGVLGGTVEGTLCAFDNSQVTVSGGVLNGYLIVAENGEMIIFGNDFSVDGEPVGFGKLTYVRGDGGDELARRLSGVLASGDRINNRFFIEDNSSSIILAPVSSVPEPSGILILSMGLAGLFRLIKTKK